MESLPDWHPHLCINYANSIHQSRSKQHCQTVDFTEATDTGIAFSSVLMQINSPITDISAIHARFRSHHVKVVGKPAYIVQTIRWIKCAVAAKSRHWKRSTPYIHSINFYMHQCTCCHNFVLFLLHGRRCYKLCETLKPWGVKVKQNTSYLGSNKHCRQPILKIIKLTCLALRTITHNPPALKAWKNYKNNISNNQEIMCYSQICIIHVNSKRPRF